jgi:hypothetical protein
MDCVVKQMELFACCECAFDVFFFFFFFFFCFLFLTRPKICISGVSLHLESTLPMTQALGPPMILALRVVPVSTTMNAGRQLAHCRRTLAHSPIYVCLICAFSVSLALCRLSSRGSPISPCLTCVVTTLLVRCPISSSILEHVLARCSMPHHLFARSPFFARCSPLTPPTSPTQSRQCAMQPTMQI